MPLTRRAHHRPAFTRLTVALIIALATLTAGALPTSPASAAKAKTWIVSPAGIGPAKLGMTAAQMKRSKLFSIQQAQNCDGSSYSYATFKPGLSNALWVTTTTKGAKLAPSQWWNGKDKVIALGAYTTTAANHRLRTKYGIKVGSSVKALLKREKHLTKTKNPKKYYPQIWERGSKGHYLVFSFGGYSNTGKKLTSWKALKKQKIGSFYLTTVKPKQFRWSDAGGSGGC